MIASFPLTHDLQFFTHNRGCEGRSSLYADNRVLGTRGWGVLPPVSYVTVMSWRVAAAAESSVVPDALNC